MSRLRIDRYGIVRKPNGERRGNDAKGFDIKQLDEPVAAHAEESPLMSRRAKQRLALAQLRSRRLTG